MMQAWIILSILHFSQLQVNKKSFDLYIKIYTMEKPEQTIVNYLIGVACEKFDIIQYEKSIKEFQLLAKRNGQTI